MNKDPLRAVILDNDETTGSYRIVYSLLKAIKTYGDIDILLFYYIFQRLSIWMIKESIFRPNLVEFLRTLVKLKKENKIDAIIMYTNQYEENTDITSSLPRCIEYMFTFLVPEFKFDHILTRPNNPTVINNVYTKHFKRVLDLYPDRPLDNTQILFFDDLAVPLYIKTDGIEVISESSRVLVEPYISILYKEDIQRCIEFCIDEMADSESFLKSVIKYYINNGIDNKLVYSPMSCSYFIELVNEKYDIDGVKNID
jgi:hypothetical protein